jgi:hypothetical protein
VAMKVHVEIDVDMKTRVDVEVIANIIILVGEESWTVLEYFSNRGILFFKDFTCNHLPCSNV